MQKIILDTIEQLNKEFGEYCPIAHKTVVSKKLESFLKQALTKAFEAGQKSREKEIVEQTLEYLSNGSFLTKGCNWNEMAKDELKDVFVNEILKYKSLSLTKESK